MKRLLAMILCMLLCLMHVPALAEDELTIVHVTDTHYLSPALTDYGERFMALIEDGDGKVTHYTPQLMAAFVEEMLALQPDAILLSGDLTFNGASRSHEDLVALLAPLVDAGIQVWRFPAIMTPTQPATGLKNRKSIMLPAWPTRNSTRRMRSSAMQTPFPGTPYP